MVSKYPNQFSGEYPSTDEARTLLSRTLSPPNKIEKKNGPRENAPNLRMKLEMLVPDLLPTVLLGIVSEYAVTWIAFLWNPPQKQLRPQVSEQVTEKFKALMSEGRYGEVVELGNSMEKDVLAKHLLSTNDHY